MATTTLYRKRQGQSPSACPPEPPRCSVCGMLECLCRPRFFPGQILTADDLNRLDTYIRGKHRLHNRQLHGWGVVNGLEVTCNPCGDGVAVGCGYALSPCGDDIVVCDAVSVDVCDLIRRCKDAERQWQQCAPGQHPSPQNCDAGEEEWILAIRYSEAPARGVKPLRPAEACGCGGGGGSSCSCGGGKSSSCGCGGGNGNGHACSCGGRTATKPRMAPVQCEPTIVCEGFTFEVYRKPPAADPIGGNDAGFFNPESELFKRFQCCVELLIDQMPKMPGAFSLAAVEGSPQAWYTWMNQFRDMLRRYFATHGAYNCELLDRLNGIVYPTAGTLAQAPLIFGAIILLGLVWLDALFACLCSALMPPCPPPSNEVRVPLAVIHVGGHPCRVLRVCNWTVHRKIAVTFPSLQYWLGVLPFGVTIRKLLEAMCCFDFAQFLPARDVAAAVAGPQPVAAFVAGPGGVGGMAPDVTAAYQHANSRLNPSVTQADRVHGVSEVLFNALSRSGETLEFSALLDSLLAGPGLRARPLTPAETANLPQFLMANQLLRPMATETVAPLLGALSGRAATFAAGARGPSAEDLAAVQAELSELRASVRAQAEEIERLRRRRNR